MLKAMITCDKCEKKVKI